MGEPTEPEGELQLQLTDVNMLQNNYPPNIVMASRYIFIYSPSGQQQHLVTSSRL